ncbi:hypothetical protein COLO4_26662 [Corchorus olitorius]|uniref:Thionin-like protein 2 n=1 Tax=Corchorus olitorius TaxID=93759 RepID=A0A1R3HUY0_9ROSI|nr:hypothetical protein COLO4_26662 [Corchorus olitorius]
MEKRSAGGLILMVFLVLGILGQSQADFISCYNTCLMGCGPFYSSWCDANCLQYCSQESKSTAAIATAALKDTQSFCKLGCAATMCSKIITTKDDQSGNYN